MEGPPLGPVGEDITWPNQVAPWGRKASSTRKIKPQTSNLCWPPASPLSVRSSFFCVSRLAVGCSPVAAAPPPPPPYRVSRFSSPPLCALFSFFLFSFSFVRPRCLRLSLVSGPGCPVPRRCVSFALLASRFSALRALSSYLCFPPGCWLFPGGCCPPPPFVSRGFRRRRLVFCFSFLFFLFFFSSFSFLRPRCLRLSLVSGPGRPGPRRCSLFALLASRFSALRALSPLLCFPPGRWLFPGGCCPPPLL